MNSVNDLTFNEIRDNFLSGYYDFESDEYVDYGMELHNKLTSIEDLLPMLTSDNKTCQLMAVYIASEEGDKACPIFGYILALIKSPWVRIRDDVCDCFTSCGSKGEEFVQLLECFYDPDARIRMKVIQVLMWIEDEKVFLVSEYLNDSNDFGDLKDGASLLSNQIKNGSSYESLEESFLKGTRIVKYFSYISALRQFGNRDELFSLVELSDEPDIKRHYEIYFKEDRQ